MTSVTADTKAGDMRTRVHSGLAVVALVAATLVGASAVPAPVGAQAEQAVALTVTPSTGLLAGHVVQVQITGLTPGERYWATQCEADGSCEFIGDVAGRPYALPSSALVTASPNGAVSTRLQLFRDDCAAGGCFVGLFPHPPTGTTIPTPLTTVPLAFEATGTYQWPQGTLAVSVPGPVVEGRRIGVSVTGMSPWARFSPTSPSAASIDMCRDDGTLTGADCLRGLDWGSDRPFELVALTEGGGTAGVNPGSRLVRHLPGGWDCAVDGCVIVVTQGGDDVVVGNPRTNAVPISYAPEWAPFPSATSFIDRAVAGVLGRAPTSAGRARLVAGLPDRSITGVQALVEAASSSKLDADVGEVVRLYHAYFGRRVETAGLAYWVGRLRSGLTPLQMARSFGGTPEFKARYGGLTPAQAVTLTYGTVLGREPSPAELQYWRERMQAGLTKADLVYSFARSPENRSRTNRAVWSTIVLFRLTGFAPTAEQLAGGPERAAADALALSHP